MTTRDRATAGAAAAREFLSTPRAARDGALGLMASRLREGSGSIFAANQADLAEAEAGGMAPVILHRLAFDSSKLDSSIAGLKSLAGLPDPVGRVLESRRLDSGLLLRRVSSPIGLIAMIFEARPDALIQMSALTSKSGNALIAKGGREAARSNAAIGEILSRAGEEAGLPAHWLTLIETREEVGELLALDDLVDLVIPRGSKAFVRHIMDTSRIPVMGHAEGICHVYVHEDADVGMAAKIAVDSKAQYPAACNAAEVLLVNSRIAGKALPRIAAALEAAQVRLDLCPRSLDIISLAAAKGEAGLDCSMSAAKADEDWAVEYLDLRMAVKVVDSLDEAIAHINRYGSGHTDSIVTSSRDAAERFMDGVDSASVYWNVSTRFADGYRYGLGAEVGISTGKLHARGPVGLSGLLTYKWKLSGSGQCVADYASGAKSFAHEDLREEIGRYYDELE
jgi:glutamate-5-semialdehyde dehydrogenase